jgi:hydrogenase-4 membrane subunit HyfE
MTYLLFTYFLALTLPLFIRSWKAALGGLRVQALALAAVIWLHGDHLAPTPIIALADMLLFRALFAPWYLRKMALEHGIPPAFDLIPANLFVWTLAAILVMISFGFSATLSGEYSHSIMHLGVACCGVLLALLILATQRAPLGQAMALLTLENGIVLFELHAHHHVEWPAQLGLALVYVLSVLTMALLVRRLGMTDDTSEHPADSAIL